VTPVTCMKGRVLAIFGLGSSGLATAGALAAGGATPICFDDVLAKVEEAAAEGFETRDLRQIDWTKFAALVLSPGVPLTHPKPHWTVELAKAAGVEVIGDIELFCRQRAKIAPDSPFIAVTGTNGKSTTTALIAHILREAGRDVQMGGNIGTPILALAPPASDRFHVVEMSSFQIDLTPSVAPNVGVLLNITPDHLDRHGTMENYAANKEQLVRRADIAVVSVDDAWCMGVFERMGRGDRDSSVPFGDAEHVERVLTTVGFGYSATNILEIHRNPVGVTADPVASVWGVASLRGRHNAQNATAAFAAVRCVRRPGIFMSSGKIAAAIKSFPGLPHRMEEVGRTGRVIFINDSKATNADSTEKALHSFDGGVFWILGGRPKEGGIASLEPLFARVVKAYLIGAATERFAATLTKGGVAYERSGELDVALARAARDACASSAKEPVVLLSPACASYDQFKNFEERGDRFRALAQALISQAQLDGATSPLEGEANASISPSPLVGESGVRAGEGKVRVSAKPGTVTPRPASASRSRPSPAASTPTRKEP
jgi:UDP-N-acetylmuramoylalanine--D-glutamate ligase